MSWIPAWEFDKKCRECKIIKDCKKKYIETIEEDISRLIAFRSYDEINEIKSTIFKIIKQKDSAEYCRGNL